MMATVPELARAFNVSERMIYMAGELQRCRPDLSDRVIAGELTLTEALRIAKPDKYRKRDKVERWIASFRSWSRADRDRALCALAAELEASDG